ncbi:MAG: hypothetical protein NXI27_20290 [Alphaproteobacteria bacterium]|nr:hypothetical protein [Alphaproteobacteria bacterium]
MVKNASQAEPESGLGYEHLFVPALFALLERKVGKAAGDALRLPYFLGDPDQVIAALDDAGPTRITVETRREQARFANARSIVEAELRGWLPLFDIHLDEEKIANVLAPSENALSGFVTATGEVAFPTSAHIVAARKSSKKAPPLPGTAYSS